MKAICQLILAGSVLTGTVTAAENLTILSRDYSLIQRHETPENQFYLTFKNALAPEFTTTLTWTNHARIFKLLGGDDNFCSYNIIKTPERSKQLLFSEIPTTLFPQKRVFFLSNSYHNKENSVSIRSLLAQNKTFTVVGSSSYEQLDDIFTEYPEQVISVNGSESFNQVSQMLLHKRVDFLVEYDYTLKRLLTSAQYQSLSSKEITELDKFTAGFFACSNTPSGQQVIAKINSLFKTANMYHFLKRIHDKQFGQTANMMAVYESKYGLVKPL